MKRPTRTVIAGLREGNPDIFTSNRAEIGDKENQLRANSRWVNCFVTREEKRREEMQDEEITKQ